MSGYLLIESRDPFESKGFSQRCELALTLLGESAGVTLFLVENAVLGARAGAKAPGLEKLAKAGVRIARRRFRAARARHHASSPPASSPSDIDTLIGELAGGAKTLWN